jgi:membrane associated rhomboid family serine protease
MKVIVGINVVMFLAQGVLPGVTLALGLLPVAVTGDLEIWRLVTYMFLHGGLFHLLFNMLVLWMFGTELERIWGTQYFVKFYFVTGVGAGMLTVLFALLPLGVAQEVHQSVVVGASGAIYGLLLAYALYFPDRPILLMALFPIPAKYFVMIIGAISLYSSFGSTGGVAHATHLGGLVVGYLYLKGPRNPSSELKYYYLRWKFNRARRKFDVYSGGRSRDDSNRPVH